MALCAEISGETSTAGGPGRVGSVMLTRTQRARDNGG
eukprot:CAMPEP_0183313608 /NCGR_PEP_ID=MMETSP0160_2-20130417/45836_1 /TAXON_ID=2839 ORGANISM="Odontella Sinensis, Strain Grunow 1884" /NCGR_SAMPLE_ID=MMETSP0160_2 /ASSEMBLY_ACC=CAM_ASM_000250 /LENGTH=36 /DNA_ID= /DNA_START= /DNA_END= /DNA_ORIENTATION=